jgi:hypothetical protein
MMERPLPLLPVGKAILGTAIMAALVVLLLPLAPVLLALLPLPAAYVTARHGWVSGLVTAVVAGAVLYVGWGVEMGLLVFVLVVGAGLTLGLALRAGWRFSRTLWLTAVAILVVLVLYGLVMWLGFGVTATQLRQDAYTSIDNASSMYTRMGMSSATTDAAADQFRALVDVFAYIAPGLLGMGVILWSATTMGLAYLIFPRLRKPEQVRFALSGLRLHWGLAYVSIAGLALLLFTRQGSGVRGVLLYVGIDLLLVSQTLFFLQALAVIRWLGTARGWRPGSKVLMFIVAVLAQLVQVTGLVGLMDTWIDYRRRFALSGPRSGPLK